VISPLFANIYLHYVLDLWADRWRRREATGDMIIVRYADDVVAVAARQGCDVGTTEHGHRREVEAVQRLAGWQARLDQVSRDASLGTVGEFEFGQRRQQPSGWLAFTVGTLGERWPQGADGGQAQLAQQQRQPRGVDADRVAGPAAHAAAPNDGSSAS